MKKAKEKASGKREVKIQFPIDSYSIAHNLTFQRSLYLGVIAGLVMLFFNYWPNSEGSIQPRVFSISHGAFALATNSENSGELRQVALLAELVEKKKEIVYSDEDPGGQYVLVVASMRNAESAVKMLKELKEKALEMEVVEDLSEDQIWYRVVAKRSSRKSTVSTLARNLDFETWMTPLSDQARIVLTIK